MDFITQDVQALFPVHLLVACSDRTRESISSKYNCSFVTLLRLLSELSDISGCVRDPTSTVAHPLNKVFLRFSSLQDLSETSSTNGSREAVARELFTVVSSFSDSLDVFAANNMEEVKDSSTPWFQAWRRLFFEKFEQCDHEFIGAYFGCLFVVMSDEVDNFKQIVNHLQSKINDVPLKFFVSSFIRYFIILNVDNSIKNADIISTSSFQEMISTFGSDSVFWFDLSTNDIIVTFEADTGSPPMSPPIDEHISQLSLKDSAHIECDPLSPVANSLPPIPPQNQDNHVSPKSQSKRELKPVVSQELMILTEKCLRQLIESIVIPWTERQLKFLNDAISARKGLRKSLKQLLGIAPGTSLRGPTGYIYKLESDEMQQRKMADLAMSLGLTEMAFKYFHAARDEFKVDGACLYFAGASEMTGVASFMLNRPQRHYFDQAISTYLDVCKSYDLASRSTLLATDCLRLASPNDAAMFFIRMTSEDCDLRSALFLEQAARCFQSSYVSRRRKASFHFVLAGHRYNKCSLRKHALSCYQQFSHQDWSEAIEHVNFTIARLLLQLSSTETDVMKSSTLREAGVELLRKNSDKFSFFQDFVKEVKKVATPENSIPTLTQFNLPIPCVKTIRYESIEGAFVRKGRTSCFVRESMTFHMDLSNSFQLHLNDLTLFTSRGDIVSSRLNVTLEENESKTVTFIVLPESVGDFDVLGLEYNTNGVPCRHDFRDRLKKNLRFIAIESLPPIQVVIKIGSNAENVDAIEMMSGEVAELTVRASLATEGTWIPTRVKMISNAQLFTESQPVDCSRQGVSLNWIEDNFFTIRAPLDSKPHTMNFSIEYYDDGRRESRTVSRRVEIFVRECLVIEGLVEGVLSVRNTLSSGPITLSCQDESLELWPGLSAHMLVSPIQRSGSDQKDSVIPWSSFTRRGFLSVNSSLGLIK